MNGPTDDQLFEAFRDGGDTAALATLFDRTSQDLLRIAVHLTSDLGDAEDLVQETFLTAIQSARSYRPEGRLRSWLVGILHNRARRLHRRRRRVPAASDVLHACASAPAADAECAEIRDRLRAAIDRMAEPYRTVLGLHLRRGLSVPEIAGILARPENTVRSQLGRGLGRLKRALPADWTAAGAAAFTTSGLERVRDAVLAHAAGGGAVTLAAIEGGLAGAGAAKAKVLLAAGAALVLATVGVVAVGGSRTLPGVPAADPPALTSRTAEHGVDSEATAEPDAPERSTVAASPAAERDDGERVRIRVQDKATLEPVAGATVRFPDPAFREIDLPPAGWREFLHLASEDRETFYERYGRSAVTDADGIVELTRPESLGTIVARRDRLFGIRWDSFADAILVEPDRELCIAITDDSGQPVPDVTLWVGVDPDAPGDLPIMPVCASPCSGPDGVARLPHVQALAAEMRARGLERVHIIGPLRLQRRELPLAALEQDTVQFGLHSGGTVEVHVVDLFGAPIRLTPSATCLVDLQVVGETKACPPHEVERGVARFDHVPLGRALELETSVDASCGARRVAGPTRPGERIEVTLQLGGDSVTWFGRAVDEGGEPLRRTELLLCEPDSAHGQRLDTDEDGRFLFFRWPDEEDEDDEQTEPRATLHTAAVSRFRCGLEERATPNDRSATLILRRAPAGSTVDLGDVTLARAPLLGRGRLSVTPPEKLAELQRWLRFEVEALGPATERAIDEARWTPVPGGLVVWDEGGDGTFAVLGRPLESAAGSSFERLRLVGPRVRYGGRLYLPVAPVEFTAGREDLRLDAALGGQLGIETTLAERAPLRFDLTPLDGQWPAHDDRRLTGAESSRSEVRRTGDARHKVYVLGPLWPGRYRVAVRANGIAEPLCDIESIEIRAGELAEPLRDAALDLARYEVATVELHATSGKRLRRSGRLWLEQPATSGAAEVELHVHNVILVERGAVGLAWWNGCQLTPWRPGTDTDIRMEPAVDVLLAVQRADAPDRSLALPDSVCLEATYADGQSLSSWRNVAGCRERLVGVEASRTNDGFRFACTAPGRWIVRLLTTRPGREPALLHETVIAIPDGRQSVEVLVPVPAAALDRLER